MAPERRPRVMPVREEPARQPAPSPQYWKSAESPPGERKPKRFIDLEEEKSEEEEEQEEEEDRVREEEMQRVVQEKVKLRMEERKKELDEEERHLEERRRRRLLEEEGIGAEGSSDEWVDMDKEEERNAPSGSGSSGLRRRKA